MESTPEDCRFTPLEDEETKDVSDERLKGVDLDTYDKQRMQDMRRAFYVKLDDREKLYDNKERSKHFRVLLEVTKFYIKNKKSVWWCVSCDSLIISPWNAYCHKETKRGDAITGFFKKKLQQECKYDGTERTPALFLSTKVCNKTSLLLPWSCRGGSDTE